MVIKQTKNHKKQKSKYLVNPQNPAESDLGRLAIEAAVLPSLGQVEGQRLLGVAPGEVVGPWVGVTPCLPPPAVMSPSISMPRQVPQIGKKSPPSFASTAIEKKA